MKFQRRRPVTPWEKQREKRITQAPGSIRCTRCSWKFEGALLADGVRAAREHRAAKHSERA